MIRIKKLTIGDLDNSESLERNISETYVDIPIIDDNLHEFVFRRKGKYCFRNVNGGYRLQMKLTDELPDIIKKLKRGDNILLKIEK